jgi:hypothetical protein
MKDRKHQILSEMIKTERGMGDLYKLYAEYFTSDKGFWEQISAEEDKHAELLTSGILYLAFNILPEVVLLNKLEALRQTNESIWVVTKKYEREMPPKEEAYNYAIQMEKSLSEAFFQELMKMPFAPDVVAAWQSLAEESVDHSKRIAATLESGKGQQ